MDTSIWTGIGFLIFWIIIGFVGFSIGYSSEKKNFNGGKCTKCNTNLRLFDYDSQGGRGYVCDNCRRHVWISYRQVDDEYLNKEN